MRPRTLPRRSIAAISVLSLALAVLCMLGPSKAYALSGHEQDYLARMNALRAAHGLGSLQIDPTMSSLSLQHTQEMVASHDLHHTADLKVGVGNNWTKLGENVGYGTSIELTWNAFVNSPGHFANLVDPAFTHVGIVVIEGPDGLLWTTHRFLAAGRPSASTATAVATGPIKPAKAPATTVPTTPTTSPAPAAAAPPPPPAPTPAPADPARVATVLDALRRG